MVGTLGSDFSADDPPPKAAVGEFETDHFEVEVDIVEHFIRGIAADRDDRHSTLLQEPPRPLQVALRDMAAGIAEAVAFDVVLRLFVDEWRVEYDQIEFALLNVFEEIRIDRLDFQSV